MSGSTTTSMVLPLDFHIFRVNVHTHSHYVIDWLSSFYESHLTETQFRHDVPYEMFIEELDSENALPIERTNGTFAKFCLLGAHCYYDSGVFYSEHNGELIHQCEVDTVKRRVRLNIGGKLTRYQECLVFNAFRDILKKFLYPFNGLTALHAAIVTRNERVLMMVGNNGTGKSTLAMAMMNQGWKLVSDDSPAFATIGGETFVFSSLDELSATQDTLAILPHLAPYVTTKRDMSGKFLVSRRLLGADKFEYGPLKVTDFLILERGKFNTPELVPIAKTLMAGRLFKESMAILQRLSHPDEGLLPRIDQNRFDTITGLVEQARPFILRYANHHLFDIASFMENEYGG